LQIDTAVVDVARPVRGLARTLWLMLTPDQNTFPTARCSSPRLAVGSTGPVRKNPKASYYRARYYDPATGRFISEDPVTFTGGIDFYPYVENNPIEFRDVFGLQALRKPNPTPLPEPPAPGPILVPDAPPLTFWDVFFDWLGDALGAGGLILANPTDLNPNEPDPSQFPNPRKIQQPECPKRGCTCTCRADADASMPGNIRPGKPLFAFGTATEKNCGDAKRAAEKIAKHALGMKTKHVQCKCAGR
jgi:RHS repeat-associated protein